MATATTSAGPCWLFRYEAAGYDDSLPYLLALWAAGQRPDYDALAAMCVLDAGHADPHRFVPQDRVGLVFK